MFYAQSTTSRDGYIRAEKHILSSLTQFQVTDEEREEEEEGEEEEEEKRKKKSLNLTSFAIFSYKCKV